MIRVRTEYERNKALLVALWDGPVQCRGFAMNSRGEYLMGQAELQDAIKDLGRVGIRVERTDAGGSPTWRIVRIDKI